MAWGTIELTTISRSHDVTAIKHNEDNKGLVEQANLGQQLQKDAQQKTREVRSSDNAQWHSEKFDAKEKSKNEYSGDGGKKRKQAPQDKVEIKGRKSFDMKV